MSLFTSSIIAARFITHKRAAVVTTSSCYFLNYFFLNQKCSSLPKVILIWVIILKSTNRTSVCVQVSMYEIILQRRSWCESQAQLQLDLLTCSECNMYQYKNEADPQQRQFVLIVLGPSAGKHESRLEGHCASVKTQLCVSQTHN